MFVIRLKKKIEKNAKKMPNNVQEKLTQLIKDLREKGPFRAEWPNYSKLGGNRYYCHLSHSWVACWKYEKETIVIEIYYVGSREKASY